MEEVKKIYRLMLSDQDSERIFPVIKFLIEAKVLGPDYLEFLTTNQVQFESNYQE